MRSSSSRAIPISNHRDLVGESPVWSADERALYWVDIEGRAIHRLEWAAMQNAQEPSSWVLPERVGCIALSNRGTVIAALETGIFEVTLRMEGALSLQCLANFHAPRPGMRFNDGRCDRQGRFWVGSMCMDMSLAAPDGGLYCLDSKGLHGPVVDGLITPNGLAFSLNGERAYLSDSHPKSQKIWTFNFALDAGAMTNRELWVDMQNMPGRPDGAAVDAEDCYWICANDAGLVCRFDFKGQLIASIPLPVAKPSMCAFGGPALRHLFITSIQPPQPVPGFEGSLDGAVLMLDVGMSGRAEPLFTQFPHL